MPLELSVWRINDGIEKMEFSPLDLEARLQDILLVNQHTVARPRSAKWNYTVERLKNIFSIS